MADLGALIHTATGLSLVVRVYPGHESHLSQVLALPVPHGQQGGTTGAIGFGGRYGNSKEDPQILLLPGEAAAQAASLPAATPPPLSGTSQTDTAANAVTAVDVSSSTDNRSSGSDPRDNQAVWQESVSASSVTLVGSPPAGSDASISAMSIAAIRMAPDDAHQAYRLSDVRLNTAMRAIELTG